MTAENALVPDTAQDDLAHHGRSTGSNRVPAGLGRASHSRRRWVGDVVRLMVGLTALISAISHLVSAIGS